MSSRYLVRIAVWPHSTARGRDVDQIQAGRREQVFEITALDFRDAVSRAELIALGIGANPIVWQAPILEVRELNQSEYVPSRYDQHDRDLLEAAKLQMPSGDNLHRRHAERILRDRVAERDASAEKIGGKPIEKPEECLEVPLWALRVLCQGPARTTEVAHA